MEEAEYLLPIAHPKLGFFFKAPYRESMDLLPAAPSASQNRMNFPLEAKYPYKIRLMNPMSLHTL
jgi:hypothetical protein